MYHNPPGFAVHGISQARYWNTLPLPPPGDLPNPKIEVTLSCISCIDRLIFFLPFVPPGRKIIFPVPVFGPVQGPSWQYIYLLVKMVLYLRCFWEVGRTYMGQCLLPYFGSFLVLPVVCRLSVLCSLSGLPIVIIPSSWSV